KGRVGGMGRMGGTGNPFLFFLPFLPFPPLLPILFLLPFLPNQAPLVRDNRLLKSGIEVISVAATVRDAEGRLIADLPRDAFDIFEDGERQTVTQFTRERVPIGLGVLLDVSDSMYGKRIQDARAAVERFLFELLDPADEFFLMSFNHAPHALTGWTRAADDVRHALAAIRPSGGTAIYDAIGDALPLV